MIEYLRSRVWIVEAALAVVTLWYLHHAVYMEGWDAKAAEQAKLEKADAQRHDTELHNAEHAHDGELASLGQYVADHPTGPVRLCIDKAVQSSGPTTATASPASPGVQPVRAGDHQGGTDGATAGPDVEDMLVYLGAGADVVSAGLRRQESVN